MVGDGDGDGDGDRLALMFVTLYDVKYQCRRCAYFGANMLQAAFATSIVQ